MDRMPEKLKTMKASHDKELLAVSFTPVAVVPSATLHFKC